VACRVADWWRSDLVGRPHRQLAVRRFLTFVKWLHEHVFCNMGRYLGSSGSCKPPRKTRGAEHHPFPLCSLSSPYSLAMWLHSTRGARAERAREGVEETGNGVVMEEVGEASDGACSLEAQRGDR
jgi:hypothetical protein